MILQTLKIWLGLEGAKSEVLEKTQDSKSWLGWDAWVDVSTKLKTQPCRDC